MSETPATPRREWLRYMEDPTNNGLLLKGYLGIESHLRALLVKYFELHYGARNFGSTKTPFNVRQLAELVIAMRLLSSIYKNPLLVLNKARNKVAHDVLHEMDADEAWSVFNSIPEKLRLTLQADTAASEILMHFFAVLFIAIDSAIADIIATAKFNNELVQEVAEVLSTSPVRESSHAKSVARMQELYEEAQLHVVAQHFPMLDAKHAAKGES